MADDAANQQLPYGTDYAKSDRSTCKECRNPIQMGVLRMSLRVQSRYFDGLQDNWYHFDCFWGEAQTDISEATIRGFSWLKWEHQEEIRDRCKVIQGQNKKRKAGDAPGPSKQPKRAKGDSAKDRKKLETQCNRLWETMEKVRDLDREVVTQLLNKNGCFYSKRGWEANLEQLADRMVFGVPERCTDCNGTLLYSENAHTYVCNRPISEYTKCGFLVKNPERTLFKVPWDLGNQYPFLWDYHQKVILNERVYSASVKNTVIQTPSCSKADVKKFERRLGEEETKRLVKQGCVVDPLCQVASDTHVYVEKINGQSEPWQALLCLADAAKGTNSYYKLQLLKADQTQEYYLFRSWGRIGTTIGGNKTSKFHEDLWAAKEEFERLFLEKSKNDWSERDRFVKRPGGLDLVEMEFDEKASVGKVNLNANASKSTLPMPIKEIISLFLDPKLLKDAFLEFDLDVQKMPLGKLSRNHILNAYGVLTDLEELILEPHYDKKAFLDLSNKFFSLIPHSFGMGKIPLIDTMEILKSKTEMLDNLLEMERAYRIFMKVEETEKQNVGDVDTFDRFYQSLKCDISVLPAKSAEYKMIQKYAKNTHGSTHDFKIEIKEVFKLDRHGEDFAFRTDISNRQLLWHGSRLTNFAGILSQGLRIAPPEAPVNGYMFGKGVYFADMISKSAQYCISHDQSLDGFLLLCEVALGNIQEERQATNIVKPKSGFNSVKGLGGTAPSPRGNATLSDGVIVPCGKATTLSKKQVYNLLYNEYIVYDEAQIKMKYLVRASISPS